MRYLGYTQFYDEIETLRGVNVRLVIQSTKDSIGNDRFGCVVGGFDTVDTYTMAHAELMALSNRECVYIAPRINSFVLPGDPYWRYRSFDSRHCKQ